MFLISLLFVTCFCVLGNGIPLETSSDDLSKYFSSRIVGGVEAKEGYAPHMAALMVGDKMVILACGATIVSVELLLTAAHCIDMYVVWDQLLPTFRGSVGSNNWSSTKNVVHFSDFHIHPGWSWNTLKNDIGFLVMKEKLVLSRTVGIMPLNFKRIDENESSYVTGWGLLGTWPKDIIPYRLQILNVTTIHHKICVKKVEEISAIFDTEAPEVDSEIEICTFHSIGHGMCNGDSGSALVSRNTNTQIGIVAWGYPCAIGAPDVFVRISGFRVYIEKIMNQYK